MDNNSDKLLLILKILSQLALGELVTILPIVSYLLVVKVNGNLNIFFFLNPSRCLLKLKS